MPAPRLPLLFVLCLLAPPSAFAEAPKPNVLLIMADDLGFSDLGCYGGEIHTPHLDEIAENGLRFSQFYNTARCWPTRGALLTGFYAQQIRRDGLPDIPSGGGNLGVRPDWAKLLPKMLSKQGYRSYHSGKWHIDGMPLENGFDHSYLLKDQSRFFSPQVHFFDDQKLPPVERGTDYYGTIAVADHAIEFLKNHKAEHPEKPFFHYLAFAAPHFPLHALPEDIEFYSAAYEAGWDAVRGRRWRNLQALELLDAERVPALSPVERNLGPPYHFDDAFEILGPGEVNRPLPWKSLTDEQKTFQSAKMAIHAAMIHRMDIEIGRVFDLIRQMGDWENTIVMFLSDNGASAEIMVRGDGHDPEAPLGSADTYLCLGPGWSTTSNMPFRRHKTWTHEGGIATPFVVSWPKGIAARGEIRRTPGHVIDVVPTVLELAGATYEDKAPPTPGKSLVPVFENDTAPEREDLWWFHDGHKAIRVGDWKAVSPKDQPWELYNLSVDRAETHDLAILQPEKLTELIEVWDGRLEEFTELASRDLSPEELKKAKGTSDRPDHMRAAQAAARPKTEQVLINGETFLLEGRRAFLMKAEKVADGGPKPWVFYGPTLRRYPDQNESWIHQQLVDAGIAVAGIDVGEAYGSPAALPFFDALYEQMVADGYSKEPALLGRSRGGLWVSSWAIHNPDRVAGIAGIYPVYDFTTYPGVERAAPMYELDAKNLTEQQDEFNPIRRARVLAEAKIPVHIIHGTGDKVVPIAENSATLEKVYADAGASDVFELVRAEGQGHNLWEGFFQHQPLVDFLIERAKGGRE